ncbi:MAG TPA: TOBE domain-containing protein, partial [Spirochaetales bacterium]|nr:TOBE domain-containing protein [Spirochaetales bacterium]
LVGVQGRGVAAVGAGRHRPDRVDRQARLLGQQGELARGEAGRPEVVLGLRPEDLPYDETGTGFKTTISVVEPLGAEIHLWAKTSSSQIVSKVPPHHTFKIGETVCFAPVMEKARYFDPVSERSILPVAEVEGPSPN